MILIGFEDLLPFDSVKTTCESVNFQEQWVCVILII